MAEENNVNDNLSGLNEELLKLIQSGDISAKSLRDLAKSAADSDDMIEMMGKSAAKMAHETTKFLGSVAKGNTSMTSMQGVVTMTSDVLAGATEAIGGFAEAIPIAGKIISGAAKAAAKAMRMAAKAANYAIERFQITYDNFTKISQVGVINSMTELRNEFTAAQIPLEKFAAMLGKSAKDLSYISGAAIKGGRTFASVISQMQSDMGMPLMRLGFSIDEIGDTIIDFQKMQTLMEGQRRMTTEELTQSTIRYGKELDLVARLTGQNRREIQKNREQLMADSRFAAWVDSLGGKMNKAVMDTIGAVKDLSPTLAEGMKDLFSSGGVATTQAGKQLVVSGIQPIIMEIREGLIKGQMTVAEARNRLIEAANNETRVAFRNITRFTGDLGKALPYGEWNRLSKATKLTNEEIEDYLKQQKKQSKGADELTDSVAHTNKELNRLNANLDAMVNSTGFLVKTMDVFATSMNQFVGFIRKNILNESEEDILAAQRARDMQIQALRLGLKGKIVGEGANTRFSINPEERLSTENRRRELEAQIAALRNPDGRVPTQEERRRELALRVQLEKINNRLQLIDRFTNKVNAEKLFDTGKSILTSRDVMIRESIKYALREAGLRKEKSFQFFRPEEWKKLNERQYVAIQETIKRYQSSGTLIKNREALAAEIKGIISGGVRYKEDWQTQIQLMREYTAQARETGKYDREKAQEMVETLKRLEKQLKDLNIHTRKTADEVINQTGILKQRAK